MANSKVSALTAITSVATNDEIYIVDVSDTTDGAAGSSRKATIASATASKANSGANSDITSLAGLTSPLSVTQGGSGAATLTGIVKGNGASAFTAVTAPTGTIVGTSDSQTLTNKTLTTPIIATISNTGTLTLPTSTDTLVGKATTDTLTNKTLTKPTINGSVQGLTTDTDGVTVTFDLSASNVHSVTLAGNRTLALSNASTGQCFIIRLIQDGTGSRTVTWFTTIKWPGGSAPTLTTTASKTDTFGFICTSSGNYDAYIIGQNL